MGLTVRPQGLHHDCPRPLPIPKGLQAPNQVPQPRLPAPASAPSASFPSAPGLLGPTLHCRMRWAGVCTDFQLLLQFPGGCGQTQQCPGRDTDSTALGSGAGRAQGVRTVSAYLSVTLPHWGPEGGTGSSIKKEWNQNNTKTCCSAEEPERQRGRGPPACAVTGVYRGAHTGSEITA